MTLGMQDTRQLPEPFRFKVSTIHGHGKAMVLPRYYLDFIVNRIRHLIMDTGRIRCKLRSRRPVIAGDPDKESSL